MHSGQADKRIITVPLALFQDCLAVEAEVLLGISLVLGF